MKNQLRHSTSTSNIINNALVDLPAPSSISTAWNVGFILGVVFSTQIVTGVVLAILVSNNSTDSFESVILITRNITIAWAARFTHINGASFMFMLVYAHIGRNFLFSSNSTNKSTWLSGILLLTLIIVTAFLGYVLPWGQMSFWGATVITNLISVIPYTGASIVQWLWGNFSVSQPTLTRFFSLHVISPILMLAIMVIHLATLHSTGSSNPTGTNEDIEKIKFSPNLINKDTQISVILATIVIMTVTSIPLEIGDVENFTQANPLTTPTHIQPEWYFLFAYAILRAVPSNVGGTLALVASLIILTTLTLNEPNTNNFGPANNINEWILVTNFIVLTWIGINPVEPPFINTGQIASFTYFMVIIM